MADSVVSCYTGLMGGGKSYMAVERMAKHFLKGGIAFTNLDLIWSNIKEWAERDNGILLDDRQYKKLSIEELRVFPRHISAGTEKNPVMVVVDEAGLFFDAREWNKTSKEVLAFITQTRKVDVELIFITQHMKDIDSKFRHRVQYQWNFVDVQKITIMGWKPPWPYMMRTCWHGFERKAKLQRKFVKKDPRIFGFYNSKQRFTDLHLKESEDIDIKKVNKEEKKKKTAIISGKTIVLICLSFMAGWYVFGKEKNADSVQVFSSPTYTFKEPDSSEFSSETGDPGATLEELFITLIHLDGDEYYIEFSNGSFLTHHSRVKVNVHHSYAVLNGIPFKIEIPSVRERNSAENYFQKTP